MATAGSRWHTVAGRPVRSVVLGDERPGVPPLVVVPGLGALGYLMPALQLCAAWTQVHLLDLPGFGRPATSRLPSDLDSVSTVLAAWLAEVPEQPVLLAGHSTGAQIALRAALGRPGAVRSLALAGATFSPATRRLPALAAAVARTLPHEQAGELPAVLPYYLRGARRLPSLLRSSLADRPEDAVPALVVPLHVLHGRYDGLCPPEWAQALVAAAPDGRDMPLPGGHNTPWTYPQQTAEALRVAAG